MRTRSSPSRTSASTRTGGVDLRGIGRALFQDVRNKKAGQGGSTITQQFVKNALAAQQQRTIFQKLREAALAYHLTRKWSKQQDPHPIPQHDLLRQRRLRDRVGRAHVLRVRPTGCGADGRAARAPPSSRRRRRRCSPGSSPRPSAFDPCSIRRPPRAPRPRAAADARAGLPRRAAEYDDAVAGGASRPQDDIHAAAARTPSRRTSRPGSSSRSSTARRRPGGRVAFEWRPAGSRRRSTSTSRTRPSGRSTQLQPGGPQAALVAHRQPRPARSARWSAAATTRAAVQPRHPGAAPAGLRVQAVRARRGAQARHPPDSTGRRSAADLYVPKQRRAASWSTTTTTRTPAHLAARRHDVLRQLGLRRDRLKVGPRRSPRLARRMGIRTPVSHQPRDDPRRPQQGVTPLDMAHAYSTFANGGRPSAAR